MSRNARTLVVSGILTIVFGASVPGARADDSPGREIPTPFAPLEYLLGKWKGQAMPKDSAQSFRGWAESHAWAWTFLKGKPTGMSVAITGGKVLAEGKLTFDPTRKIYRLDGKTATPPLAPIAFEGTLDRTGKRLVLDQVDAGKTNRGGETLRISLRPNSNFIRYTMSIERKTADAVRFHPMTEVGLTKEGESLAGGTSSSEQPKCIVTGGSATMTIAYQGRTFPICCSGCRDEFNENPEKYIKKASLITQAAGSKKSTPPTSAVSRFEDAFAGDVSEMPKKKAAKPPSTTPARSKDEPKNDETPAPPKASASASRAASLLRIDQNLEKSGKVQAALAGYKRIVKEFGDTPAAKIARERIKAIENR